jgi:hypothetical protein
MFGVSATLANYSPERAFVSCYQHFEVTQVSLMRERRMNCGPNCYSGELLNFSTDEITDVRAKTGLPFHAYPTLDDLLGRSTPGSVVVGSSLFAPTAAYDSAVPASAIALLYRNAPNTYAMFETSVEGLSKEFQLGEVSGNFPSASDEVLITSYRYEGIRRYGYSYEGTDGKAVSLTAADCANTASFLEKKPLLTYKSGDGVNVPASYHALRIVGVVGVPASLLQGFSDLDVLPGMADRNALSKSYSLDTYLRTSFADALFGPSGFYQEIGNWNGFTFQKDAEIFSLIYSAMSLDEATIKNWYHFLRSNQVFADHPIGLTYEVHDHFALTLDPLHFYGDATSSFSSATNFVEGGKKTFFWIGFGTACFAALLLATFIASSIAYQRRKIGILRALGARGGDIYAIFYNESLLITLACSLIAAVITAVLDQTLNGEVNNLLGFTLPVFQFTFGVFLLILVLAVVTATIASLVPCLLIAKKKPIDSINEK